MKNLTCKATIALLTNIVLLVMNTQPLVANECTDAVNQHGDVQVVRLEHAKSVTFNYEPGQSAILANDQAGTADLVGRSVVRIDFEPVNNAAIGYGVEPVPPLDITHLLAVGSNTVQMITVHPLDTAWIRITSPCSDDPLPTPASADGKLQITTTPSVAPTATREPVPTSALANAAEGSSIASTPPVLHTQEVTKIGKAQPPVVTHEDVPGLALLPLAGRVLLGLALLAAVWLLVVLGSWRRWWQWLFQRNRDGLE